MKVLSSETINKYDYKKTKQKVDQIFDWISEAFFEKTGLLDTINSNRLSEVRVDRTPSNCPKQLIIQIRKETLIEEFDNVMESILFIVEQFTEIEQKFFKGFYFNGKLLTQMAYAENLSERTSKKYFKSAIIKFALAFNLAVKK